MAATNYVPQTVLVSGMATTTWTPWQGNWGRYYGRTQPWHPTLATPSTILGEVREGVYAEDMAGLAYGPETLWVRSQAQDAGDGLATGGEELTGWIGVPATLPGGFTGRNARNIMPATSFVVGASDASLTQFQPTYSPSTPIRTPAGLYVPKDDTEAWLYGPWNRDNLHEGDNTPSGGDAWTFNRGLKKALGPSGSGASMDGFQFFDKVAGTDCRKTAGYRSVRAMTFVTPTFYNGTGLPAGYPRFQSATGTIGLSSGHTRSFSCARADLSFDATQNYYVKDHGNIGDLLPTVGEIAWWMQHDYTVTYDWWNPATTWLSGIGMSHVFWFCPRVDIPLPFSATYGNLVAPGGILTGGNVPGY